MSDSTNRTTPDPPKNFEQRLVVADADIDQLGHVNNVVYLQWIQDIAVAHWSATAPEEDKKKLFWVVTRHEIDYKRQAFLNDAIVVRTWVGRASRLLFERHTEILNEKTREILVKAKTVWCPIDVERKRPTAVSAEVRRRFSMEEIR